MLLTAFSFAIPDFLQLFEVPLSFFTRADDYEDGIYIRKTKECGKCPRAVRLSRCVDRQKVWKSETAQTGNVVLT